MFTKWSMHGTQGQVVAVGSGCWFCLYMTLASIPQKFFLFPRGELIGLPGWYPPKNPLWLRASVIPGSPCCPVSPIEPSRNFLCRSSRGVSLPVTPGLVENETGSAGSARRQLRIGVGSRPVYLWLLFIACTCRWPSY